MSEWKLVCESDTERTLWLPDQDGGGWLRVDTRQATEVTRGTFSQNHIEHPWKCGQPVPSPAQPSGFRQ